MRLGFAVFRRRGGAVVQNASEFDGFGPIPVISPRLRRILEQPSGNPPERPETQTHFGPPGGTAADLRPPRWWSTGDLSSPGGTAHLHPPEVGVLALAGAPPSVDAPPPGPNGAGRGSGTAADLRPPRLRRVAGCPPGSPQGCVSKSVRARSRRGSLETQPFLSPRFRPSFLLGGLPSLVSHTRAGIRKHRAAHNGGIKPLCATTCCVNPALVCVTGSSGRKGNHTHMTTNRWAAPHEERPTGPQNQVLVSRTDWGADFPRGAVEPSRILGGRPARARSRPGVRPGRCRPGPARRSRGGLRP